MINQQLLDYIRDQKDSGTDDSTIKENLESAGWRSQDVQEGFQAVESNLDGGDDNSTSAHQDMRAEATADRADSSTSSVQQKQDNQSDIKSGELNGSGGDADSDDPYREEPETSDESAAAAGGGQEALGDSADQSLDESNSGSGPQEKAGQGGKNISPERMEKMSGEPSNAEDFSPKALRTFQGDQRDAGGEPGPRSRPKQDTESDAMSDVSAVGASSSAAKEQAPSASTEGMSEERKEFEDRENQAAKEESDLNKVLSGEPVGKKGDRNAGDGRREFSSQGGGDGSIKKRRKKSRSSGGSGWVSIALFIVAVLLVGGGGYYGYTTFFSGGSSVQSTTAARVVQSLANAGSFNYRVVVLSSDDASGTAPPQRRAVLEGYLDLNNENSAESYYELRSGTDGEGALVESVSAETESLASVPDEQLATVRELLLNPKFFSIGEFQTTEQLGQSASSSGFTTNRFRASGNPEQLIADYANLHQALFGEALAQDVINNLQSTIGDFQPTNGQAWIDQENGVPYQLTFFGTNGAGEDVQIDFMFKNHGIVPTERTPAYTPQSFADSFSDYFAQSSDPEDVDVNEGETETDTPPGEETLPPVDNGQAMTAVEIARRNDLLRVNDVQQISVALAVYADENNRYPETLSAVLSTSQSTLSDIPTDPETGSQYSYNVSVDGSRYHLGSTLRQLRRAELTGDADFNSRAAAEFETGFNGTAANCSTTPRPSVTSSTCYDVTDSVDSM